MRNKSYPESLDKKEINYYIFGRTNETYIKDGDTKEYARTARIEKKEPVYEIIRCLISSSDNYLRHRSHVDNISKVLPLIRESFEGRYIELDFSENISMKPKYEVQDAHFSGKKFALHCSIVEPGEEKYVYNLSVDATHP